MNYLTLIDTLNTQANLNVFVQDFFFGPAWETVQVDNIVYPCVYVETPSISSQETPYIYTYSISFQVLDRVLEDLSNVNEIMSKTKQIGEGYIKQIADTLQKGSVTKYVYNMIPLEDALTDRVYGWRFEIELRLKNDIECQKQIV